MNTQASIPNTIEDVEIGSLDGFLALAIQVVGTLFLLAVMFYVGGALGYVGMGLVGLVSFVCLSGYTILDPNQVSVMTFFGRYVGTLKTNGFRWNNPLYSGRKVSMRLSNFESKELKVNDLDGNPINISAVIVWRVKDAAQAVFAVDDYDDFINVQSESSLRHLATKYSYDSHEGGKISLRESQDEVAGELKEEVQKQVAMAGIEILDARLNKLSYAPEIASAMLQRQQAQAVVSARQLIVQGACGMVEMALAELQKSGCVELDEERKAQMVSNLLVVLCGDRAAQPVVNTGSIHS